MAAFRARQRKRPLAPYENVMDEHAPVEAAVIVADGWKLGPFPRIQLSAPLEWDEICAQHRSWHFHLQEWDPIATVLAAYDATPAPAYLSWALELGVDWARSFSDPAIDSAFAWYDMALGVRAYRLAYLIDVAARNDAVPDDEIAWLLGAADIHRELLADDDTFASHSNHGFYQAAGQLALARRLPDLPRMKATATQANERFRLLMGRHFSTEGVHLEHSPEYQWNLMQGLSGMISSGLGDDPEVVALYRLVQESMAWFVAPNSTVVLLGDSTAREPKVRRLDRVLDDALRFVATKGGDGHPPIDTTRLFASAGYAVLRDRWPEGPEDYSACSYLAQTCAFHSRVHKHADHMSFVWYDREREILTDSGRYGYVGQVDPDSELFERGFHYSDPHRVYVESTRAHNSVEIDGHSFPRRRVSFFGSGVTQAGESGGVLFAESELYHLRTVRHHRVLLLRPREWLIVFDWLRDGNGEPHDYRQWFQFAPELDVERTDNEQLLGTFEDGEQVRAVPLLPSRVGELACGQQDPMLGWISRTELAFDPRPSACYVQESAAAHVFATLVALGTEPIESNPDRSRVNASGRNARLSWQVGDRRHDVNFGRTLGDEFDIEYVVS